MNPGSDTGSFYFDQWLTKHKKPRIDPLLADEVSRNLVSDVIRPSLTKIPKPEQFQTELIGHKMCFISELVHLCGPVLIGEIMEIIGAVKVQIAKEDADRFLYLLEKLKILRKRRRGHNTYYVPIDPARQFVQFRRNDGKPFDRAAFTLEVRDIQIGSPSYKHRMAVYSGMSKVAGVK